MVAELDCPVSQPLAGVQLLPQGINATMTQDSLVCGTVGTAVGGSLFYRSTGMAPGTWLYLQVSRGLTVKEAF